MIITGSLLQVWKNQQLYHFNSFWRGSGKGEKERYTHLSTEFQRIASKDKKAFLSDQCKEVEENNRMGKTRYSSRKLEIPREHFMQRWAR